jgi:hypothetical protein
MLNEISARRAGFTVPIIADASPCTLELLVRPGTDFDATFAAYDRNANEMLQIHGWHFLIEPDYDEQGVGNGH